MKLLAIDTSTDYLSLAITNGEKVIGKLHRKAKMSHSSLLIPTIDKLLKKTKLKLKDIDGFSISIGPGSFTGLRIGVATVKGLAYSLKKPIVAVPTLDVIADNAKSFRGVICPVLDAKKNKVYACLYRSDGNNIKRISKYLLLSSKDLLSKAEELNTDTLFLGDAVRQIFTGDIERAPKFYDVGWGKYRAHASIMYRLATPHGKFGLFNGRTRKNLNWHPKAEVIGQLGAEYFKKKRFVKPEDLEPLYLYSRECDIKGI